MASLTKTIQKIKCGEVVGLQPQVQTLLSSEKNGCVESQQIIRYCSRYVYENPELEEGVFSSILDIVSLCCGHQKEQSAGDPTYHFKSMYYIVLTAVKRKDFFCYLVGLLTDVEPIVRQCDATTGDSHSITKSLYQSLWNTSLTLSDPLQALTLQRFSLQYLIASGMNVSLACSQTVKAHLNYEDAVKSPEHLDTFYRGILSSLIEAVQKQKTLNEDVMLNMCNLVMEYAKVLLKLNLCANFSKVTKALLALCEKNCNEQILLAVKIGLKVTEAGMAFKIGRCGGEMMRKLVGSCSMAPKVLVPNTIVLRSILAVLAMFRMKEDDQVSYSLEEVMLTCLLDALLARCQAPVSQEDARKVTTVLYQHLGCFVKMMQTSRDQTKTSEDQTTTSEDQSKATRDQERVLTEALVWLAKTKSFMSRQPKFKADWVWQMYNIGVNSGNIGVLAFRVNLYEMATKFLEMSVDMLDQYRSVATQQQVEGVVGVLSKRVKTWSDALRYSGQHWEAGVAVGQGLVRGCLPLHELVTMWVKCKRDAEKGGSKTLQGVTVCDVVSEARRRHQETEGFTFNTVVALKEEIKCYRSQGYNTSEDELSCGRKLAEESQGVEDQAQGLLAVAVALMRSQKGATACLNAIKSVNSAITLLEGAKTKGQNTCGERELLAQAHFWLYLCQLQHFEMTTGAVEVQEPEISPTSLTTQATDLGEEVQVDDACDVRPSALSVTLQTHQASLAPLNTALTIWQDLVAQGVELEDLRTTCDTVASAGYVYQVCGLMTPTLTCWVTLVSFARSHHLHTLLVKGVTELLLVAPELVPEDLVREAEVALARCQEDAATTPQDTSPSYLTTSLHAATAIYCLKKGQYKEGASHLSQALSSDTMTKQTTGSTEVQTLVHLAASQYALLPPHLLPAPPTSHPAYFYAILACRQAIALIRSTASCIQGGLVCWRHRVAWLHLTTTAWLGRLCLASAQPRTARAYLKQSLSIAQQFTLALWMAELLELLARVDLLCDQFEDCRVKVESLQDILAVHSKHSPTHHTLIPAPCSVEAARSTAEKTKHKVIQKHVDRVDRGVEEEQWMRAESTDYDVKTVAFNPSLVVVGNKKRLPLLTKPQLVASPSMGFRENVSLVRVVECPDEVVGCVLCSTPLLHQLLISTGHLLAMLHAYAGRRQPAITCLNRALEMYLTVNKKASEISTHLSSIVKGEAKGEAESRSMFVSSRLNEVRLRIHHGRAEVLALEEKMEDALTTNMEALSIITTLPNKLLYQDVHIVLVLQLQGLALQKMIVEQQVKTSQENPHEELLPGEEEESKSDFNTPVRIRGPLADPTSCLKSPQKFFKTPAVEGKAFSIFSDEDDNEDQSRLTKTVAPKTYRKPSSKTVRKGPTNSFSKPKAARSFAAKKKVEDMNDVSSQFNLLNLSDSPSDIVLEVPKPALIRTYKKSSQQDMKDVKRIPATSSNLPSSKSISKPEKGVCRRGRPPKVTKPLDSDSDKTSPDSSQSSDGTELFKEPKTTITSKARTTTKGTGEKTATSRSRSKEVPESKPVVRSRASRSLRLI